jgi:hypothetical protein
VISFTTWLETTALSVWVRESPTMFAFPFILVVHAWGMGLMAGGNAAIDLRILGFAPRVPLSAMSKFYPVMWFGFLINAISGFLLLMGYPTKALTNPVFYLKLAFIAVGVVLMSRVRRKVFPKEESLPGNAKGMAALSLLAWAGAITAGRLLAYTCTHLLGDIKC